MKTVVVTVARKTKKASTMRRLHRLFGAGAAIFVIFMVLSGIAINHSNGLGLDKRHLSQPFLLSWYGLDGPEEIHSFAVGNDWLSFAGSQMYLNDLPVETVSNGVGAVINGDLLVAAGSDELLLLDQAGQLIERTPWDSAGADVIESIGVFADGTVVVQSANQLWVTDAELLNWQPAEETNIAPRWSSSEPVPLNLREAITQQYRGNGPSLERVLLDFHSGRIFGSIGLLVYDLLALAVGFLAISGVILWWRGRRNGKR
jgi:hypothetical protein